MGQDNETSTSNLGRTSALELAISIKLSSSFYSVMLQVSFQLTSTNDLCTFLIYQHVQFCTLDNSAANNALPKCGQTMELQQQQYCRFGLGLDRFLLNLTDTFNFTFQFSIATGQTFCKSHALRKCSPLAASLNDTSDNEKK